MPAAVVNGITIEYEEHGPSDGEAVLLVMGLGAQLVLWPPAFIEALVVTRVPRGDLRQPRHRTVVADRRPGRLR